MKVKKIKKTYQGRHYFFWGMLIFFILAILARIFYLQSIKKEFYNSKSSQVSIRDQNIYASRGIITDRNGAPLAMTTNVSSIWANPQQVNLNQQSLIQLAHLLNIPYETMKKKLQSKTKRFIYLKRRISPMIAKDIMALKLKGIYKEREYRRFYPMGEVTANLLGFTNINDKGQEGVELAFNDLLQGYSGKKRVLKNRLGESIKNIAVIKEPSPGGQLVLTINSKLQYMAYAVLKQAVKQYRAKAGSAVILNVKNGDILAMVTQPSFNPNDPQDKVPNKIRNRVVTDLFEPGSVMKPFSIMAALENNYPPDSKIDTNPGWYKVGSHTVKDIRNYGTLDLAGVLRKSSNVAVSKIILNYPPDTLVQTLLKMRFGQKTSSGLPGESKGLITRSKSYDQFSQATLAFGYGISTNLLQLAQAYAIIGAQGIYHPIRIKKTAQFSFAGERIVSQKQSQTIMKLLTGVTQMGGSGYRANVPGYNIIGKTGTVRKLGKNGYDPKKHIGLFVGLIPARDPVLSMAIMIDEPQGKEYYGGLIAAPVFSKVMTYAMRLLDIPADNSKLLKNVS